MFSEFAVVLPTLLMVFVVAETGVAAWAVSSGRCDMVDDEARMAFREFAELAIPSICR